MKASRRNIARAVAMAEKRAGGRPVVSKYGRKVAAEVAALAVDKGARGVVAG